MSTVKNDGKFGRQSVSIKHASRMQRRSEYPYRGDLRVSRGSSHSHVLRAGRWRTKMASLSHSRMATKNSLMWWVSTLPILDTRQKSLATCLKLQSMGLPILRSHPRTGAKPLSTQEIVCNGQMVHAVLGDNPEKDLLTLAVFFVFVSGIACATSSKMCRRERAHFVYVTYRPKAYATLSRGWLNPSHASWPLGTLRCSRKPPAAQK